MSSQQKYKPSSKCNQISLILGELYNDVIMCCGRPSVDMDKLLKKQLADYALRFDNMVAMSEKDCYDKGYEDGEKHFAKKEQEVADKVVSAIPDKIKDMET